MLKRKIKIFIRRIKSMSFKRMFNVIGTVHKLYGANRVVTFFDMVICAFKYGVGYLDYMVFGFAKIHGKKARSTFMTMNHNLSLVRQMNKKECYEIFDDKLLFNKTFKQFIGRDYIDLNCCDYKALADFCKGKQKVFAKQPKTFGGQGICSVKIEKDTDFKKLYKTLFENKQYLVEDAIIQHKEMDKLCPTSVNTIRMVTFLKEGEPLFAYSLVRMGSGKTDVDNITSGGMYAPINDGVITKPAFCDKALKYYDVHPLTQNKIVGFNIPYFKEGVEMCLKAARVVADMGYVGWDVAITEKGPVLVEGNNFPSYDMVQNYGHIEDGQGIRPKIENLLSIKL